MPPDPQELMIKTEPKVGGELAVTKEAPEDVSKFFIISFEAQAKNHALKGIKYVDTCVKVYSWIWTLCTQATRDTPKTVPDFTDFKRLGRTSSKSPLPLRGPPFSSSLTRTYGPP